MAGCGAAFALINSTATIAGGSIDPALFVALARFFNYHWFPSYMGTFWEDHARLFLPFLGTVSLALMSFQRRGQPIDRLGLQCLAGFVAMLALTLLGIIVSLVSESAFLIKLALHRASLNALMVGGIFIVARLYNDFVSGGRFERAMAAAMLVAPFNSSSGIAPGLAVIRVGYEFAVAVAGKRVFSVLAASGVVAACIVALFAVYAANGLVPIVVRPAVLRHQFGDDRVSRGRRNVASHANAARSIVPRRRGRAWCRLGQAFKSARRQPGNKGVGLRVARRRALGQRQYAGRLALYG